MNPAVPPPLDPHTAKAVNDVIEYGGKAAVSLAAIAAFVRLIAQPVMKWRETRRTARKKADADLIREVLRDEIARLDGICDREEQIIKEYGLIVQRQEAIFHDLDLLLEIALDNRERLDEMNALMDELGLASRERREREQNIQDMIGGLAERRKARRRRLPIADPEQRQ